MNEKKLNSVSEFVSENKKCEKIHSGNAAQGKTKIR
jgi:hypothetical protein